MKFKKRLAVLLSAAMVMGMTVPAGATVLSTNEVPGSDSKTGHGEKEAHLEREVANIILPTISDNAFDFTVDPERLVRDTQGARFADAGQEVESTAMDAGVFFQVSDNKYDSKTPEFEFENRSSYAIDLTVEVEAIHNVEATDLALLSSNEVSVKPASVAGLYLGLKVGDDLSSAQAKPILYDAPAKTTISVDGVARNFTVSWNSTEGYHNKEKDSLVDTWKKGKFQIEGIATEGKDITDDTSAPSIKVTWSWKRNGALEPNKIVIDGTTIFVKLFEDTSTVVAGKLGTVKINKVAKSAEVTSQGVIKITDAAPTAGNYVVSVVYDGTTYTGSGTK